MTFIESENEIFRTYPFLIQSMTKKKQHSYLGWRNFLICLPLHTVTDQGVVVY